MGGPGARKGDVTIGHTGFVFPEHNRAGEDKKAGLPEEPGPSRVPTREGVAPLEGHPQENPGRGLVEGVGLDAHVDHQEDEHAAGHHGHPLAAW